MITEKDLTKQDWLTNRFNNETLIKTNLVQIMMAKEIIALCDKKIAEFPEDKKVKKPSMVK